MNKEIFLKDVSETKKFGQELARTLGYVDQKSIDLRHGICSNNEDFRAGVCNTDAKKSEVSDTNDRRPEGVRVKSSSASGFPLDRMPYGHRENPGHTTISPRTNQSIFDQHTPGAPTVIALRGDLGVGKSELARAFIREICGEDTVVPSPTFTLVQTYVGRAGQRISHFDLYRVEDVSELEEIGLSDAMKTDICLIEWPELAADFLPKNTIDVTIKESGAGRILVVIDNTQPNGTIHVYKGCSCQ